jgi:hypothetical protein
MYFDGPAHAKLTLRPFRLQAPTGAVVKPQYIAIRGG